MSILAHAANLFRTVEKFTPPLVERVPVIPPCRGWLVHNTGLCGCYDSYPRERALRREQAMY